MIYCVGTTGSCSSSLALDGDSRVRVWKERCFAASAVSSNSTGGANNETASGNSAALPTLDEATSILTGSAHSLSGKHHDITKRVRPRLRCSNACIFFIINLFIHLLLNYVCLIVAPYTRKADHRGDGDAASATVAKGSCGYTFG